MKHGMKLRKLGRTPSHRQALLRNLVSALLHHEQIKTTLPKAKEAARLAEGMITLGKRGTIPALRSAQGFLFPGHHFAPPSKSIPSPPPPSGLFPTASTSTTPPSDPLDSELAESFSPPTSLLPKLFSTLTDRYRSRPGGYTRIQKYGNRIGDHAPHCVLSLVDGPRDLQWEMAGRVLGKEVFELGYEGEKLRRAVGELVRDGAAGRLRDGKVWVGKGREGSEDVERGRREVVMRAEEVLQREAAWVQADQARKDRKAKIATKAKAAAKAEMELKAEQVAKGLPVSTKAKPATRPSPKIVEEEEEVLRRPSPIKVEQARRDLAACLDRTARLDGEGRLTEMVVVGRVTKMKVEKVLKYRTEEELVEFERIACDFADTLRVKNTTLTGLLVRPPHPSHRKPSTTLGATTPVRAGLRVPGSATASVGLQLAQQSLGRIKRSELWSVVEAEKMAREAKGKPEEAAVVG